MSLGIFGYATTENPIQEQDLDPVSDGVFDLTYDNNRSKLTGTYTYQGHTLYIEMLRGIEIPESARDPFTGGHPKYEIDFRIMDQKGNTLVTQYGGHAIDPTWGTEPQKELTEEELKQLRADMDKNWQIAFKLGIDLEKVRFKKKYEPEYRSLKVIIVDAEDAMRKNEQYEKMLKNQSHSNAGGIYTYTIEAYKQPAFLPVNPWGDHSGVRLYDWQKKKYIWRACNHGTCPGEGGMTYPYCSATQNLREIFPEGQAPECLTPIQWETMNPLNPEGKHTCNDDTYVQIYRVIHGADYNYYGGTCYDNFFRNRAPDCTW